MAYPFTARGLWLTGDDPAVPYNGMQRVASLGQHVVLVIQAGPSQYEGWTAEGGIAYVRCLVSHDGGSTFHKPSGSDSHGFIGTDNSHTIAPNPIVWAHGTRFYCVYGYALGYAIIHSDDYGETWSTPVQTSFIYNYTVPDTDPVGHFNIALPCQGIYLGGKLLICGESTWTSGNMTLNMAVCSEIDDPEVKTNWHYVRTPSAPTATEVAEPAIVEISGNRARVFARNDTTRTLWTIVWDNATETWGAWSNSGIASSNGPAVVLKHPSGAFILVSDNSTGSSRTPLAYRISLDPDATPSTFGEATTLSSTNLPEYPGICMAQGNDVLVTWGTRPSSVMSVYGSIVPASVFPTIPDPPSDADLFSDFPVIGVAEAAPATITHLDFPVIGVAGSQVVPALSYPMYLDDSAENAVLRIAT